MEDSGEGLKELAVRQTYRKLIQTKLEKYKLLLNQSSPVSQVTADLLLRKQVKVGAFAERFLVSEETYAKRKNLPPPAWISSFRSFYQGYIRESPSGRIAVKYLREYAVILRDANEADMNDNSVKRPKCPAAPHDPPCTCRRCLASKHRKGQAVSSDRVTPRKTKALADPDPPPANDRKKSPVVRTLFYDERKLKRSRSTSSSDQGWCEDEPEPKKRRCHCDQCGMEGRKKVRRETEGNRSLRSVDPPMTRSEKVRSLVYIARPDQSDITSTFSLPSKKSVSGAQKPSRPEMSSSPMGNLSSHRQHETTVRRGVHHTPLGILNQDLDISNRHGKLPSKSELNDPSHSTQNHSPIKVPRHSQALPEKNPKSRIYSCENNLRKSDTLPNRNKWRSPHFTEEDDEESAPENTSCMDPSDASDLIDNTDARKSTDGSFDSSSSTLNRLSNAQYDVLRLAYHESPYPTKSEMYRLAVQLMIPVSRVVNYFSCKRQGTRKKLARYGLRDDKDAFVSISKGEDMKYLLNKKDTSVKTKQKNSGGCVSSLEKSATENTYSMNPPDASDHIDNIDAQKGTNSSRALNRLSNAQYDILRNAYCVTPYPTRSEMNRLADQLQVPDSRVVNYFICTRQGIRKKLAKHGLMGDEEAFLSFSKGEDLQYLLNKKDTNVKTIQKISRGCVTLAPEDPSSMNPVDASNLFDNANSYEWKESSIDISSSTHNWLSSTQEKVLRDAYHESPYPTKYEMNSLAVRLKIPISRVLNYFIRMRQGIRNKLARHGLMGDKEAFLAYSKGVDLEYLLNKKVNDDMNTQKISGVCVRSPEKTAPENPSPMNPVDASDYTDNTNVPKGTDSSVDSRSSTPNRLTNAQYDVLRDAYCESPYLSHSEVCRLADKLQIPNYRVVNYFMSKRHGVRRRLARYGLKDDEEAFLSFSKGEEVQFLDKLNRIVAKEKRLLVPERYPESGEEAGGEKWSEALLDIGSLCVNNYLMISSELIDY